MALDATEVVIAGSGHVYTADEATALPTDLTTPGVGYTELGYTTDDGVTYSRSRQTDDLAVWQSYDAVRTITTGATTEISFVLRQFNPDNVLAAFGGGTFTQGTGGDPGVLVLPSPSDVGVQVLIVDAIDGASTVRWVFERVQVGGDIEINMQSGDAMNLPITFRGLASTNQPEIRSNHPAWVA